MKILNKKIYNCSLQQVCDSIDSNNFSVVGERISCRCYIYYADVKRKAIYANRFKKGNNYYLSQNRAVYLNLIDGGDCVEVEIYFCAGVIFTSIIAFSLGICPFVIGIFFLPEVVDEKDVVSFVISYVFFNLFNVLLAFSYYAPAIDEILILNH